VADVVAKRPKSTPWCAAAPRAFVIKARELDGGKEAFPFFGYYGVMFEHRNISTR
jgi:hypothetical protein